MDNREIFTPAASSSNSVPTPPQTGATVDLNDQFRLNTTEAPMNVRIYSGETIQPIRGLPTYEKIKILQNDIDRMKSHNFSVKRDELIAPALRNIMTLAKIKGLWKSGDPPISDLPDKDFFQFLFKLFPPGDNAELYCANDSLFERVFQSVKSIKFRNIGKFLQTDLLAYLERWHYATQDLGDVQQFTAENKKLIIKTAIDNLSRNCFDNDKSTAIYIQQELRKNPPTELEEFPVQLGLLIN